MRLKKAHSLFLESCRNLREGRDYWRGLSGLKRWILETVIPVPLLSLHEDGARMLSTLEWLESHSRGHALTVEAIQHYHRLISSPKDSEAGEYRKGKAFVIRSNVQRPHPKKIAALMAQLDLRLQEAQEKLDRESAAVEDDVLEFAAFVHQRIAFIHPFRDVNGRVARIAMNHVTRRYGQGYVILPPLSESKAHFEALEEAHRGDMQPFLALVRAHCHRV